MRWLWVYWPLSWYLLHNCHSRTFIAANHIACLPLHFQGESSLTISRDLDVLHYLSSFTLPGLTCSNTLQLHSAHRYLHITCRSGLHDNHIHTYNHEGVTKLWEFVLSVTQKKYTQICGGTIYLCTFRQSASYIIIKLFVSLYNRVST